VWCGGGGEGEGEDEGEGLCWALEFGVSGDRVRVEGSSWPPPPTPRTKEELAAAAIDYCVIVNLPCG
jgi:hypothetical protein